MNPEVSENNQTKTVFSREAPSKLNGYPLFFDSSTSAFPKKTERSKERAENAETCIEIARKRFEDELK